MVGVKFFNFFEAKLIHEMEDRIFDSVFLEIYFINYLFYEKCWDAVFLESVKDKNEAMFVRGLRVWMYCIFHSENEVFNKKKFCPVIAHDEIESCIEFFNNVNKFAYIANNSCLDQF